MRNQFSHYYYAVLIDHTKPFAFFPPLPACKQSTCSPSLLVIVAIVILSMCFVVVCFSASSRSCVMILLQFCTGPCFGWGVGWSKLLCVYVCVVFLLLFLFCFFHEIVAVSYCYWLLLVPIDSVTIALMAIISALGIITVGLMYVSGTNQFPIPKWILVKSYLCCWAALGSSRLSQKV